MGRNRHQIQPTTTPVTSDALRRQQLATEALITAAGASGVITFNSRSGAVSLTGDDIELALGFLPEEGGGGVTDGDKGQIVVSSGGTVWNLDTGAAAANLGFTPTSVTGLTGTQSVAAFKTGLGLVKADVGLGSVDNTADSAKAVLSATKLTTARTINGVSFDGTGNITISATVGDGDKGDVVISGSGTVYKVESAAPASGVFAVTGNMTADYYATADSHLFYSVNATTIGFRVGASGPFFNLRTVTASSLDLNNGSSGDVTFSIGGAERARVTATGFVVPGFVTVTDEAYGAGWNGSLQVPTKNAVYDKIAALEARILALETA